MADCARIACCVARRLHNRDVFLNNTIEKCCFMFSCLTSRSAAKASKARRGCILRHGRKDLVEVDAIALLEALSDQPRLVALHLARSASVSSLKTHIMFACAGRSSSTHVWFAPNDTIFSSMSACHCAAWSESWSAAEESKGCIPRHSAKTSSKSMPLYQCRHSRLTGQRTNGSFEKWSRNVATSRQPLTDGSGLWPAQVHVDEVHERFCVLCTVGSGEGRPVVLSCNTGLTGEH